MITDLRADFERQAKEIESKYEKKMRALRDELDLRRKTEIHEIEVCAAHLAWELKLVIKEHHCNRTDKILSYVLRSCILA